MLKPFSNPLQFILVLVLVIIFKPASALTYNGVSADSNFIILPGFTIPLNQVIAATNGYSNFVSQAQFTAGSNVIATTAATATLGASNYMAGFITNLTGNVPGNPNNLLLSGLNNLISQPMSNSVLAGGVGNRLNGGTSVAANQGCFMLGGVSNTVWPGVMNGIIGARSSLIIDANFSTILNGTNNAIELGNFNTILGGNSGLIGGGNGSTIIGGASNSIGTIADHGHSGCLVGGNGAIANNENVFVWCDLTGLTNSFGSTSNNQFLVRATGGVGINTNNPGTNALRIGGNGVLDLEGTSPALLIGGTNIYTLFNPLNTSNGLSTIWNYNLTTTSNGLQAQIFSTSNSLVIVSNSLNTFGSNFTNSLNTVSNKLQTQITVSQSRANQLTIAANDTSTTYSFTTPMPDGNFYVVFTPVDSQSTSFQPYYDSTAAGHFIAHINYATNAFDCHYSFIVQEYNP